MSAYKAGNTGSAYATTFGGGRSGPHVLVNAVTHGNELCGAIAVDLLFRENVRPTRGRLTLSFANVGAYHRFDPANPTASRFVDEDFNRLWSPAVLDGPRDSAELRRARAMRPLLDTADFLYDIHSMQTAVAPLMMAGPLAKGRDLPRALGIPEHLCSHSGHLARPRKRACVGLCNPQHPHKPPP